MDKGSTRLPPTRVEGEGLPIWRRFQVEIGGRWQLVPDKNTTWAKWAWDPFANIIWPGKRVGYRDVPDGLWAGKFWTADYHDLKATALFYWASGAIRILGLDIGGAILFRPAKALPAEPASAAATKNPSPGER